MSKGTKLTVFILFFITLGLGAVAMYIGSQISTQDDLSPTDSSANQCTPPAGKIGNDGGGGCCGSFTCQEGGQGDSGGCREWEVCDVSNGACASGTSCREAECRGDGQSCSGNSQCCSGTCNNGTCSGGSQCKTDGNSCSSNGECCSNRCGENGQCIGSSQADNSACARGEFSCESVGSEDTCWTHAGSGCTWINGACGCNRSSNPDVRITGNADCSTIRNEGTAPGTISLARCYMEVGNEAECRQRAANGEGAACGSETIVLQPGETINPTGPGSCGLWQLDAHGEGFNCSSVGCNWNESCNPETQITPTPTPTPTPPPPPPAACGDGSCDSGETCDGNTQCIGSGQFTPGECRANCTYCGDGVVQTGEQCDDGNTINDDSCNNSCMRPIDLGFCGDGILAPGEECEPSIPNSCGPGGTCNPTTCDCQPVEAGVCGSACSDNSQCPADNECYQGRCRLSQCVPGNQASASNIVCTSNGCELVVCGSECGPAGQCPNGLACNAENRCVLIYCANNNCQDECRLPETALTDEQNIIFTSLLLTALGALAYRLNLVDKAWTQFQSIGGDNLTALFSSKIKRRVDRKKRSKSRNKFEDRF